MDEKIYLWAFKIIEFTPTIGICCLWGLLTRFQGKVPENHDLSKDWTELLSPYPNSFPNISYELNYWNSHLIWEVEIVWGLSRDTLLSCKNHHFLKVPNWNVFRSIALCFSRVEKQQNKNLRKPLMPGRNINYFLLFACSYFLCLNIRLFHVNYISTVMLSLLFPI